MHKPYPFTRLPHLEDQLSMELDKLMSDWGLGGVSYFDNNFYFRSSTFAWRRRSWRFVMSHVMASSNESHRSDDGGIIAPRNLAHVDRGCFAKSCTKQSKVGTRLPESECLCMCRARRIVHALAAWVDACAYDWRMLVGIEPLSCSCNSSMLLFSSQSQWASNIFCHFGSSWFLIWAILVIHIQQGSLQLTYDADLWWKRLWACEGEGERDGPCICLMSVDQAFGNWRCNLPICPPNFGDFQQRKFEKTLSKSWRTLENYKKLIWSHYTWLPKPCEFVNCCQIWQT